MTDVYEFESSSCGGSYSGLVEVTRPPVEPLTLDVARAQCRVFATGSPPSHPEDALISNLYLPAARRYVEGYLRRTLVQRQRRITYAAWVVPLELLLPPVQGVEKVEYLDVNGTLQTLPASQYVVDLDALVPRIFPALGVTWPMLARLPNAVRVTYIAGYPAVGSPPDYAAGVPEHFRWAIAVTLADMFENREKQNAAALYSNETVERLLYLDRVFTL